MKLQFLLWQSISFWQALWRRPMVRFVFAMALLIVFLGWLGGGILGKILPKKTSSVAVVTESRSKTKLNTLLQTDGPTPQIQRPKTKQWIACDEVRKVLFDSDRWYVGCRGGVLVMTPQGKILRQFSQADGISNDIVTDLVLIQRKLFIGTQDGLNVVDLDTEKVTVIRVQEGLVSGSNLTLAADGDEVWVGTFDGVSRIHVPTMTITNYRSELMANATNFNVHRIMATSKAVYISLIGSAYSSGGLARFDKQKQQFEQYPAERFFTKQFATSTDVHSINYLAVAAVNDQLLLHDGSLFWTAKDAVNLQLTPQPSIHTKLIALAKDENISGIELLGSVNSQVALRFYSHSNSEQFAIYIPGNKEMRIVSPQDPARPMVLALSKSKPSNSSVVDWINLADRPMGFGSLLAAINSEVWLSTADGVWSVDAQNGVFTRRIGWTDQTGTPDQTWLVPMPDTNQALFGRQICGMGCLQPEFWLISWPNMNATPIALGDDEKTFFQAQEGEIEALNYQFLSDPVWDAGLQGLAFNFSGKRVAYIPATKAWKQLENADQESTSLAEQKIKCHQFYTTDSAGVLHVSANGCPNELGMIRVNDFAFSIGRGQNSSDDWLLDGTGKKIDQITAGDKIYSPFEGWTDPIRVVSWNSDADSIWLAHNRGLAQYTPQTATWQLYLSKAGLTGQIIQDMLLMPDWVVVFSRGGLAIVSKDTASTTTP